MGCNNTRKQCSDKHSVNKGILVASISCGFGVEMERIEVMAHLGIVQNILIGEFALKCPQF
uniref:Hydroxyacyl-thioester dehydratase type 2-like isoform X2 n=1 Tax=Rhizophora mucronata TaxID=61149 RepID=A0A2P2K5E1_RHIMU